jgi:hypothetical protein
MLFGKGLHLRVADVAVRLLGKVGGGHQRLPPASRNDSPLFLLT